MLNAPRRGHGDGDDDHNNMDDNSNNTDDVDDKDKKVRIRILTEVMTTSVEHCLQLLDTCLPFQWTSPVQA